MIKNFYKGINKTKENYIKNLNKNNIHYKFALDNICQIIKVFYHKILIILINDFYLKFMEIFKN